MKNKYLIVLALISFIFSLNLKGLWEEGMESNDARFEVGPPAQEVMTRHKMSPDDEEKLRNLQAALEVFEKYASGQSNRSCGRKTIEMCDKCLTKLKVPGFIDYLYAEPHENRFLYNDGAIGGTCAAVECAVGTGSAIAAGASCPYSPSISKQLCCLSLFCYGKMLGDCCATGFNSGMARRVHLNED